MKRQRGKKVELAQRRQRVADLYVQGRTQAAIASEIGVAVGTVCNDLKVVQKQWRDSTLRDFDAARELELQKLDRIERESWDAWERSKQPAQSGKVKTLSSGAETTEKSLEHQTGDPRYLDQVLKCIEKRCALLGLDAPTKVAPVTPDGQPLSIEQRNLIIQNIIVEQFGAGAVWKGNQEAAIPEDSAPAVGSEIQAADILGHIEERTNGHADPG